MIDVCDRIRAEDDQKVHDSIAGSESGKMTLEELMLDTRIEFKALREHLDSMKSRGIITSNRSDDEVYYKLACG